MALENAEADTRFYVPDANCEVGGARNHVGRAILQTRDPPPVTRQRAHRIMRGGVCSPYLHTQGVNSLSHHLPTIPPYILVLNS